IPEDSTLRRHYLQNLAAQADSSADITEVNIDAEVGVNVAGDNAFDFPEISEPVIPEDVVLKRHHIQKLVAETEAAMPPRPTDSMLRRHYDTHLLSTVMGQLDALK
ncbi:MAG: hypothetical protein DRQ62_11380, partial [Gammaproteobacteria bacterium]